MLRFVYYEKKSMYLSSSRQLRQYFLKLFQYDLTSGIVIFLVAIPLCLGIAIACHAPLYSGIISGIIGGIIVGGLSRSQVSVSGPSAAIVAIVITALSYLPDFNTLLVSIFIAGILQIYAGKQQAGFFADYIPSNVIQGMLSAIGLLLILKQLPLALTVSNNFTGLKVLLFDASEASTIKPLLHFSFHMNSGALILSLMSLLIMWHADHSKSSWLKSIPGPISVVLLTTLLNEALLYINSPFAQHGPVLVKLPSYQNFNEIWHHLAKPNWNALNNPLVYLFGLLIAVVTSLESLLNIKAIEKLDPRHQNVDKDQELIAQGLGNLFAGLLGGIPISSLVIRSSINIQSRAKTKIATILHGVLLLYCFYFVPSILNHIPLCILASILIYTGYKLTKPKIYFNIYQQGLARFIPFIATVIGILCFNLLVGIILGLALNLFFLLRANSQARIDIIQEHYPSGVTNRLLLPQQTTFLNKASLVAELNSIPKHSQLIIDARFTTYIDKEILEFIKEFQEEQAPEKSISLNLIGFKEQYDIHDHINFINVSTYDAQTQLNPKDVLEILKQGNERFVNDQVIHRSNMIDIHHTAETQHPIAIVLGCIDSRVPVETVFDMTLGDLFCVRVAGNVINDDILASIEYACNVVGAKLIVVLGHTRCGAIQAACNSVEKGHITQLLKKIQPAISIEENLASHRKNPKLNFIEQVTHFNIAYSMLEIFQRSPILRDMILEHKIGIVGGMYDVSTGIVQFSDYQEQIRGFEQFDSSELIASLSHWFPEKQA